MQSWTAANAISCGSLSEQLRLRVIEEEIAIRSNESNHQRLKAVADNADYVAACNKLVASQLTAAQKWRLRKEVSPDYTFGVNRDFKKRSDADQTLIAYRDDQGWQVSLYRSASATLTFPIDPFHPEFLSGWWGDTRVRSRLQIDLPVEVCLAIIR